MSWHSGDGCKMNRSTSGDGGCHCSQFSSCDCSFFTAVLNRTFHKQCLFMLFLKGGQVAVSHCASAVILAKHQMESVLAGSNGDGVRQLQHRQWQHGTCPSAVGTVCCGGFVVAANSVWRWILNFVIFYTCCQMFSILFHLTFFIIWPIFNFKCCASFFPLCYSHF